MKKQTAVDFIIGKLAENGVLHSSDICEAKEMENQQMFDYIEKNYVNGENSLKFHQEEFEKYYNETFNKEL